MTIRVLVVTLGLLALATGLGRVRVGVVESVYVCWRVKGMVSSDVLPYGK